MKKISFTKKEDIFVKNWFEIWKNNFLLAFSNGGRLNFFQLFSIFLARTETAGSGSRQSSGVAWSASWASVAVRSRSVMIAGVGFTRVVVGGRHFVVVGLLFEDEALLFRLLVLFWCCLEPVLLLLLDELDEVVEEDDADVGAVAAAVSAADVAEASAADTIRLLKEENNFDN